MGDYYKFKKILVILMIISCGFSIIKNIFKTKVQASEAIEVTPTWNDGSYTNQSDNNYLTLMNNQLKIQDKIIYNLMYNYKNNYTEDLRNEIYYLRQRIALNWNGSANRFAWFGIYTGTDLQATWFYQEITVSQLSNIVFDDATLNNGYKITNVPFYQFTRNGQASLRYYSSTGVKVLHVSNGTALIPCAEVGYYSTLWVDLFQMCGFLPTTGEYESLLADIEETNQLNYTQNYYTKQAVQNTYNYLTSDNIDEVASSGISSPETQEPDLSDAIDSVQSIFERYDEAAAKQFTLRLPNGYTHIFAISPDILENALIRVGGNDIIIIIQTLWYIGVYGLMIFAYLKIYGSVLGGNLDNIVGAFSPMTSVLHSSLEVTGAFSIGDSTSFISLTKKG